MRADIFTTTGESHLSCQDYSRMGPNSIVLSDGCSSSLDTDIGSRLVALAALQVEREGQSGLVIDVEHVARLAFQMANNMGLTRQDILDATLLMIQYRRPWVDITMVGDGVCGWKMDGTTYLIKRNYEGNAPMYVGYVTSDLKDKVKSSLEYMFFDDVGRSGILSLDAVLIEHDKSNGTMKIKIHEDKASMVFVATDGMLSFYKNVLTETSKTSEVVKLIDVAPRFLSFKTLAGQFVSRRAKKALQEMKAEGCIPMDDFSMGVVLLDKAEETP